jgi:hypothetical protein
VKTHNAVVGFGKYQGTLVTRVPLGYLKWAIANHCSGQVALADGSSARMFEVAPHEMQRRGERLAGIEVSAHAVDRLSDRHLDKWRLTREKEEGLYSWMQRKGLEAWSRKMLPDVQVTESQGLIFRIEYDGIVWVIEDLEIPVVKTVF